MIAAAAVGLPKLADHCLVKTLFCTLLLESEDWLNMFLTVHAKGKQAQPMAGFEIGLLVARVGACGRCVLRLLSIKSGCFTPNGIFLKRIKNLPLTAKGPLEYPAFQ